MAIFIAVVSTVAWSTHVVLCLAAGTWFFLIAGAVIFPIAIAHGVASWCGFV
jgi:hypothetical protein